MPPTRPKIASLIISVALVGFAGAAIATANVENEDYAKLGSGSMGNFFWESWVEASPKGALCVAIQTSEPTAIDETLDCGGLSPSGVVLTISNGKKGRKERTVVVLVAPGSARRVTVDLGSRGVQTMKLKRLSDAKAKDIGVAPVAYWARGFAGPFCLGKIVVYDSSGQKLSESQVPCG